MTPETIRNIADRTRRRLIPGTVTTGVAFVLSMFGQACFADLPETYCRPWGDPALCERIDRDIEKHRKGDAIIGVIGEDGKPVADATIAVRQEKHGFLFGCNLFVLGQLETPELNQRYETAFTNLFNFATLPFYWCELEPEEGKPRFAEDSPRIWRRPPPDLMVKWCAANGITPKGHALMYVKNKFMPDWTVRDDGEALIRQGVKHAAEIAARYGGSIPIWDVVNEEIPRRVHPDEWHAVPPDFLAWCFQEADRLFPKETALLINDGTLQAHYNTSDYAAMAKGLLQRGIRIGGIGIQFHASRDDILAGHLYSPGRLSAVYASLGRLGLPLYITEITINGTGTDGPALQAAVVTGLYRLWFSTPSMAGITWWNLGDGTAYGNENKSLGGLLAKDMNPKPAYQELDRLINHEWKTRLTLKTDADGKARFRGFHGDYIVALQSGARTARQAFHLKKGATNEWIIKL